jgi:hypothetical protein
LLWDKAYLTSSTFPFAAAEWRARWGTVKVRGR